MSNSLRTTRDDIMGMPITIEILDGTENILNIIFDYFQVVDARFSMYKTTSEIMQINRNERAEHEYSEEMKEIFALAEQTHAETDGYFSITKKDGTIDPSGIVKGWAIRNAARLTEEHGCSNYFIDAGGDIQSCGVDAEGMPWTVGIRNPFECTEIIKVVQPSGSGVATSGTSIRGQHVYNPHKLNNMILDIVSTTVIGPDIYEADRFATAAFAMGSKGIFFIENLTNFEGYQIDSNGIATMTSNFAKYTL